MTMLAVLGLTIVALGHAALAENSLVTPDVLNMLRATGQDEKLAELLGIEDVSLLHANEDKSEDPFLSNVSPLGDILLTREESEQARQGINLKRYQGNKWSNNVIPYYVNPDDFNEGQQNKIHRALEDLSNSLKNLKIRRYESSDTDYVYVISGKGCYASLGKRGNSQTVSLEESGCVHTGIIQHEFIHSAGMNHEHNRPDRDNFVRVIEENIPADWQSQYKKGSSADYDILGDYDHYSVMHYRYNAPETNKPAFEIYDKTVDTSKMGQRNGPTNIDLQKIDNLYSW